MSETQGPRSIRVGTTSEQRFAKFFFGSAVVFPEALVRFTAGQPMRQEQVKTRSGMIERKEPRSNTIGNPDETRFAKFIFAQNWEIAEAMVIFHGESSNDRARAANGNRAYLRRIRSP